MLGCGPLILHLLTAFWPNTRKTKETQPKMVAVLVLLKYAISFFIDLCAHQLSYKLHLL